MDIIKTHFSKTVDDYEIIADKVVFKNNELHKKLVEAINFNKNSKINILDLGCGTGHGIKLIAEKFPEAKITGIDFSPKMIKKSKEGLTQFSNRVKLLEEDFNEYNSDEKYEAITSAAAIHNSSHEQKIKLFKKIYNLLEDGGIFINADFYKHESEELDIQIRNIYRNFLKQNLKGEELEVWIRHAFEEDMPMKLSQQSDILKQIGFSEFKLIWLFNNEAIYIAKK